MTRTKELIPMPDPTGQRRRLPAGLHRRSIPWTEKTAVLTRTSAAVALARIGDETAACAPNGMDRHCLFDPLADAPVGRACSLPVRINHFHMIKQQSSSVPVQLAVECVWKKPVRLTNQND